MLNFSLRDLLGSSVALLLFPLVDLFPGFVVGYLFNLFQFRTRSHLGRLIIGIVLSNAMVPISTYLLYRFTSSFLIEDILFLLAGTFFIIELLPMLRGKIIPKLSNLRNIANDKKVGLALGFFWIAFSLLLLIDLQIGQKLYFSNVAYDYTTRVSIIDAITRTGIPPINPSYFPGHPVKLTFLYYYWYIPVSLVNQIGGIVVSSHQAMIAGVAWSGLSLMATIGLYLRQRARNCTNPWHAPLIGLQLLLVSGVDILPVLLIEATARKLFGHMIFYGQIEAWNPAIMSWLNAITWVPNHTNAAAQCITAMLAILSVFEATRPKRFIAGVLAGIAFASALGTSVWVTLLFALVWIIWMLVLFLSKKKGGMSWIMLMSGLVGAGLSIPFVLDILHNGGGSTQSSLPIALFVRPFLLSELIVPEKFQAVANLLLLPLNYLMELGFFFVIGFSWLQRRKYYSTQNHDFVAPEIIMLGTTLLIGTFVYSSVEQRNDLGTRGWLLGQFVLLVWAVDVVEGWLGHAAPTGASLFKVIGKQPRTGRALQILLILGILTTSLEAFSTRFWPMLVDWNVAGFPNNLSSDRQLGARTYAARQAYEYIHNYVPSAAIIQNNPKVALDRPSGLYGDHQMVISDRTAYGVPTDTFRLLQSDINKIFESDDSWAAVDRQCDHYFIAVLVINDLDPLWQRLSLLQRVRIPLYQNQFYSLISCGSLVKP